MRRRPCGSVTRTTSPGRRALAGLTDCSLTSTLPPSHASAARLRVLNTRAAHSHLSTRTDCVGSLTSRRYHRAHERRSWPAPTPARSHVMRARLTVAGLLLTLAAAAWAQQGQVVVED